MVMFLSLEKVTCVGNLNTDDSHKTMVPKVP